MSIVTRGYGTKQLIITNGFGTAITPLATLGGGGGGGILRKKRKVGKFVFPDDLIITNKRAPKQYYKVKEEEESELSLGFAYRDKDKGLFFVDSLIKNPETIKTLIDIKIKKGEYVKQHMKGIVISNEIVKSAFNAIIRGIKVKTYPLISKIFAKTYENYIFMLKSKEVEELNSNINVSARDAETTKVNLPDPDDDILEDIALWEAYE